MTEDLIDIQVPDKANFTRQDIERELRATPCRAPSEAIGSEAQHVVWDRVPLCWAHNSACSWFDERTGTFRDAPCPAPELHSCTRAGTDRLQLCSYHANQLLGPVTTKGDDDG